MTRFMSFPPIFDVGLRCEPRRGAVLRIATDEPRAKASKRGSSKESVTR